MNIKYFLTRHRCGVTSASFILALSFLLSRFLGLIRDRLLAGSFGTGRLIDAYQISFLLPDFIYSLFIIGALSASFIPVFIEVYQRNKKSAWALSSYLFNILGVFIIIIISICFLFTPQIVQLLGKLSAYTETAYNEEDLNLIVHLTRIMLISPLLLGFSALATGILQSLKRFFAPALSPLFYNIGIIGGILFLAPSWKIYGVAFGVAIGAFLHFTIQIPSLGTTGFRYSFIWKISPAVKRVVKLAIPRTFGLVAAQANFWINKIIAFTIGVGAVSVYYFSNNLQFLPIGLFGTSIAIATFPNLARSTNGKNRKEFIQTFSLAFRQIIFLTVPASVIFLLLRAQIVRIVLGTGEFDWEATILTTETLGFFALSIFAQSLVMLLVRAFYALQDTKTPVLISVGSLVVNVVLAIILSARIGVAGLALAYSAASFINMLVLLVALRLRMSNLDDVNIIKCVFKIILASFVTGAAVYDSLYLIAPLVDMQRFWGIFVQASGATLIGIGVYIFFTWILRCAEIKIILEKIKKMTKIKNQ